jgi:DNA modification methylase
MTNIFEAGLTPDRENANEGTQRGRGLLEKSLRQLGAGRSILTDKDGNVIAGNKTLETAADIDLPVRIIETDGNELVVVKRTDLDLYSETDKRARQLAYADNKISEVDLAWKPDQIAVDFEPLELKEWGFDNPNPPVADAEPQIDRAAELNEKWQVKTGDLWQIGKHRLLCGDSTKREDVERVTQGEKITLNFSDPPYGIERDEGFEGFEGFGGFGTPIARRQYSDEWDSVRPSKEQFEFMLSLAANSIIWGGNFFADILPQSTHWIVWDKNNTMPTFGDCELAWTSFERKSVKKYEITYNGLIGKEKERFHPTQKPVKLYDAVIPDYSKEGDIIIDFYGGTGTTMLTCENTKRISRVIEGIPNYCAVILERMATAFPGIEIERID